MYDSGKPVVGMQEVCATALVLKWLRGLSLTAWVSNCYFGLVKPRIFFCDVNDFFFNIRCILGIVKMDFIVTLLRLFVQQNG